MLTVHSVRAQPKPREEVFRLYWYFAAERQAIFERRVAGQKAPWTNDRILATFKFCNVFRASDRVSQYLIRDVAYDADAGTAEDRLFQIVAFRTFSKVETWRGVRLFLGRPPRIADLVDGSFERAVDHVRAANNGLYTGAFILCATDVFGRRLKHLNHIELFREMFVRSKLADRLRDATSLRAIYELFHEYPLMGDFMSYQTAIDVNYSDVLRGDFNENSFTKPGPGALRGIRKVFTTLGDFSPEDAISWMVDCQSECFQRYDFRFNGLWGRPLHAIDCQGLFCEVDKYCREAIPALASARRRIKARYTSAGAPFTLRFPEKWGLDSAVPTTPVFGADAQPIASAQDRLLA